MKVSNEEVEQMLNLNTDITREEYKQQCKDADKSTKAHGVEGKASLNINQRNKVIQMNFYGSMMNFMININSMLLQIVDSIEAIKEEIKKE